VGKAPLEELKNLFPMCESLGSYSGVKWNIGTNISEDLAAPKTMLAIYQYKWHLHVSHLLKLGNKTIHVGYTYNVTNLG
jgi:hypothetical protein